MPIEYFLFTFEGASLSFEESFSIPRFAPAASLRNSTSQDKTHLAKKSPSSEFVCPERRGCRNAKSQILLYLKNTRNIGCSFCGL